MVDTRGHELLNEAQWIEALMSRQLERAGMPDSVASEPLISASLTGLAGFLQQKSSHISATGCLVNA